MNFSSLETKRLLIRRPESKDIEYFKMWLSDPELAQHVGGVRSPERIQQTFDFIMQNWAGWGFGTAMVVWKESGEIVGSCGINKVDLDGTPEYDLGYLIVKSHWRMGLATEAAEAVVKYASQNLGISRVTAWPSHKNQPSVRVVEKLGFKFEKTISKTHAGKQLSDMSLYIWLAAH